MSQRKRPIDTGMCGGREWGKDIGREMESERGKQKESW
jgi:hypothetical protein